MLYEIHDIGVLHAQDALIAALQKSPYRCNGWYGVSGTGEVYIRMGSRRAFTLGGMEQPVMLETIDVANATVWEPYRRCGVMKSILEACYLLGQKRCYQALYVENVHNEHLKWFLGQDSRWIMSRGDIVVPSFYTLIEE
jgi:hypothetical protein